MSRSAPNARPERPRLTDYRDAPLSREEARSLLGPLIDDRRVILAVSGGPDSVALMRLAAGTSGNACDLLSVATVDHGLRAGTAEEARQIGAWATECRLAHRVLDWEGDKPKTGIQELARQMRYYLLMAFARESGASHVLTAHTLDDQAETVVMRLVGGSGISGLSGMRHETTIGGVILARPFLGLRKARLVATCCAEGWPYLEDPSNADPRFARARFRNSLMPALAREGLSPERAGVLARRAQRVEDALARRADTVIADATRAHTEDALTLDGACLAREPEAILLAVVARAIVAVLGPRTRPTRLERFERIVLTEVAPALSERRALRRNLGGALLTTRRGCLVITPEPPRRAARSTLA